jgi:uncharacterized protein (DUF1697 family)
MPMPRQVILLRGINVGAANRVSMPVLREALAADGFADVQTYVQSGNIVVSHAASPAGLAAQVRRLVVTRFGLDVSALVRTRDELAAVVERNPLHDLAQRDPKHFLVTFLSQEPSASVIDELKRIASEADEPFVASGRELYSWHPGGIHLSKLAPRLTDKRLKVDVATARNWTTVTTLLEMAADGV